MKKLTLLLILVTPFCVFSQSGSGDLKTIGDRLFAIDINDNYNGAQALLSSQQTNGSWTDVNYADQHNPTWLPVEHLNRLSTMAVGYGNPKSPLYQDKKLLGGIETGLQYWIQVKPVSDNWWWNLIGLQLKLMKILTIVAPDIPKPLLDSGTNRLYDPSQVRKDFSMGQNLVWFSQEQLVRGVLLDNPTDVQTAVNAMGNQLVFAKAPGQEGIQPDYSFHQHGAQLYNGGYGLQFLVDILNMASLVQGTSFALSQDKIDMASNLLTEGTSWMTVGNHLNIAASGKSMTLKDKDASMKDVYQAVQILSKINPARNTIYDSMYRVRIGKLTHIATENGSRYFWTSDFLVQRRDNYYASVKMISNRTVGTESGTGQNLKGGWLPFGFLSVTNDYTKDDMDGIFPIWDWLKIPGATTVAKPIALTNSTEPGDNDARAAGVSDGSYGAASMQVHKFSLRANKAYFFFDDVIVALGSGISAAEGANVYTTLAQRLQAGTVYTSQAPAGIQPGEQDKTSVTWVLHDSTGFFFPTPTPVNIRSGAQTGNWGSINKLYDATTVQKNVYTLWIDHGQDPSAASYAYMLFPRTSQAALSAFSAAPYVTILKNTTAVQGVTDTKLGLTEAVFYQPGRLDIGQGNAIQVDKPCMVLLNGTAHTLTVGNSSLQQTRITVTLTTKGQTKGYPFTYTGAYSENPSSTQPIP